MAVGVAATLIVLSRPAKACSYALGFDRGSSRCEASGDLPPNGVVSRAAMEDQPVDAFFDDDGSLDARLAPCVEGLGTLAGCSPLARLAPGVAEGTVLTGLFTCPRELVVRGAPDTTPPSRPVIADVAIDLTIDPAATGCMSCPDTDAVTVYVSDVSDDRAPQGRIKLAFYVGSTLEEAKTRTTIDHLVDAYSPADLRVTPRAQLGPGTVAARAIVGESVGRARPEEGLLRSGPLCFAVEAMDWAGNFSERSDAICIDHTDEDDPHVQTRDGSCACMTVGLPRSGSALLVLLTVASVAGTLRRARRRSSVSRGAGQDPATDER